MDCHKYQKLLYWKDFVMNCFCFQIICDHLIVMRYSVMGDHVMAINVPQKTPKYTLLTIPDPRSHYRNDTVVLIFCFNRAQSPPNLHQTLT